MPNITTDIAIVGAGPAGATAAFFLAQAKANVLVIDQATFPRDKPCGDIVNPAAVAIMDTMGMLPWLKTQNFAEHQGFFLSSPNGTSVRTHHTPGRADYPGYIIPRRKFDHALIQQAVKAGARLLEGTRIVDLERETTQSIRLLGKTTDRTPNREPTLIEAKLVIIAEGSNSSLTRKLGLVPGPADGVALRCYYEGVSGEPGLVELHWEKSVLPAYGWIFHMQDGLANVGTGMFTKDIKRLNANLNERLETFITQNTYARETLANARRTSRVVGMAFRDDAEHVTPYTDNVMLVGDAAGTGHPMTGEGIGPAMENSKLTAKHALAALERGDFSAESFIPYGRDFHALYDRHHRAARLARTALTSAAMVDRSMKRASHDPVLASLLNDILCGVRAPVAMLKPGIALRVLLG